MNKLKIFFYFLNILLFIFYLYPGSILGCIFIKDCNIQPQITRDFIVSSNHLYVFLFISLLGLISFKKNNKNLLFYLIFISFFLELMHLIIPNRGFQFSDLFGNISGVILSILIFTFL